MMMMMMLFIIRTKANRKTVTNLCKRLQNVLYLTVLKKIIKVVLVVIFECI